jgi:hypothetical protein
MEPAVLSVTQLDAPKIIAFVLKHEGFLTLEGIEYI